MVGVAGRLVPVAAALARRRRRGWGLAVAFGVWIGVALVTGVPWLRRRLVTGPAMRALAPRLPRMSDTERVALDAGTVWWDGELFSGAPDWQRMLDYEPRRLTDRERIFLDGPCSELCRMLDDHAIRGHGDLPPAVWSFIKRHRFMGMIIPETFGGLGFSAAAHGAVIARLASRSAAACVTVMVPNSLGPAELLLRYGTAEQKQHYLPRLAVGDEVPCFALTEPHAGSDAAAIRATGIVCQGVAGGRRVLGMRLSWDKRFITLAPVATVLGLAFKLRDPDHLLGDVTDLGITCALVPVSARGVWIGHRHDPMATPFQNGPTRGLDVFVALDQVIGGPAMIGHGWRMVMESLSAGRSLSLPADAVGAAQLVARTIGAYATVREQFGTSIGRFEGVQAKLGRIAGTLCWMNAVRTVTAGAVDDGERPERGVGDREAVVDGGVARHRRRRDGHRRRLRHLQGRAQRARADPRRRADRDHRRRRKHPHALADRVRPGRDALPSVRARRADRRGGAQTSAASTPRSRGTSRSRAAQRGAQLRARGRRGR